MLVDTDIMGLLQRTSAGLSAGVAAAFLAVDNTDPATTRELGSGALVSWGKGRFVNRAIGVSLDPLGGAELDELEAFFDSADVPPSIEVCSWGTMDLIAKLAARRFVPVRNVDVLIFGSNESIAAQPCVAARPVDEATRADWSDAFVRGFATTAEENRLNRELAGVLPYVSGAVHLLAEIDGDIAGCGSLYPQGPVGWVGGGATLARHRRRGVHAALLAERIRIARELGCDLIAATAVSGSASSRNMQRHGFILAATVLVMTRPYPTDGAGWPHTNSMRAMSARSP